MWNPYKAPNQKADLALKVGGVLAFLVVWAFVAGVDIVGDAKLTEPWNVVLAFIDMAWDSEISPVYDPGEGADALSVFLAHSPLFSAVFYSGVRILVAWLGVVTTGLAIGIFMGGNPTVNSFLTWIIDPFRSAPIVALLPLFTAWFGIGETTKIMFLWAGAAVFFVPMVRDAIVSVPDVHYIKMHDLGGDRWEAFRFGVLPLAWPRVWDGNQMAISIMWTYITVAEMVRSTSGLGQLIQYARRSGRIDYMLAAVATIILVALLTNIILTIFRKKLFHWEASA